MYRYGHPKGVGGYHKPVGKQQVGGYAGGPGPVCPPAAPIVAPTQYIVRDFFHPQEVQVIHPVQIINRHHCVPIPKHVYSFQKKDVFCSSVKSRRKK